MAYNVWVTGSKGFQKNQLKTHHFKVVETSKSLPLLSGSPAGWV
jgi:hypothetical protein